MEAHDAGHVFAEVVAAGAAGGAGAAGQPAEHDDDLTRLEAGDAGADGSDLAGRLGADHKRILALGEGHAAIAPDVEVIERDRADADLDLARARWGRRGDVEHLKLLFLDEAER